MSGWIGTHSFFILLFLLTSLQVLPAYGHANLILSDPPQGAVLPSSPSQVSLRFTEQLEQGFSSVSVLDTSGRRVDQQDITLSQDKLSMSVSLPQLPDGVYTVSWKVVSAVDGHTTEGSFSIGIGNVSFAASPQPQGVTQTSTLPSSSEVFLRWVMLASQVALMGSVAFRLLVWEPSIRQLGRRGAEYRSKASSSSFNRLLWLSFALIVASTVALLLLHVSTVSGGSSDLSEVISQVLLGTRFGSIWILRVMVIGIAASILYVYTRSKRESRALIGLLGVAGAALLLTMSLNSHSAGAGILPLISDWIHLIGVSFWVGSLFQMVITISSLHRSKNTGKGLGRLLTILIPRFSILAVLSLAVIGVTGFFNSYVQLKSFNALSSSLYGTSLFVKLLLILPMVLLGALNQSRIYSALLKTSSSEKARSFLRSIRLEASLGITVLLVVGLLTGLSPPPLELQSTQQQAQGLIFTGSNEGVNVNLGVYPGLVGINEFSVNLFDAQGKNISDVEAVHLEFTPSSGSIGPSEADAKPSGNGSSSYTLVGGYLSMPGNWSMRVQVKRQQAYDSITNYEVSIREKPKILSVSEFQLPIRNASPYDVKTDPQGNVWFTIPQFAKIGKFNPRTQSFTDYTVPGSNALPEMLAVDQNGTIWFTDPIGSYVFSLNPNTGSFKSYSTPTPQSFPEAITTSNSGLVWFTERIGNKIANLNPASGEIKEYPIPTPNATPLSITTADNGDVWFTESTANKIGRFDAEKEVIQEYTPKGFQLNLPISIALDRNGLVWFSEPEGNQITVLNATDQSFKSYRVKFGTGYPYGIAIDDEDNIWFAEHYQGHHAAAAIAKLTVKDGSIEEYPIPTPQSNSQWITLDQSGNVWFAEADGNRLGVYGSIAEHLPTVQTDPFFTNTLILASIALIGGAIMSSMMTWRRLKAGVKNPRRRPVKSSQ